MEDEYRVTQQCCPGGNRPETPRRPPRGGFPDFLAKSLANQDKIFKKNLKILSGFASDLAEISGEPPEAPVMIGPS